MQIISWVLFFSDFIAFYTINIFAAGFEAKHAHGLVIFGIVFACLAAGVLTFAVIATKKDPTDPLVYEERELKAKG